MITRQFKVMYRYQVPLNVKSVVTSFSGALWFVNRHRTDRLVTAAQVAERHSGIQHMKQRNL